MAAGDMNVKLTKVNIDVGEMLQALLEQFNRNRVDYEQLRELSKETASQRDAANRDANMWQERANDNLNELNATRKAFTDAIQGALAVADVLVPPTATELSNAMRSLWNVVRKYCQHAYRLLDDGAMICQICNNTAHMGKAVPFTDAPAVDEVDTEPDIERRDAMAFGATEAAIAEDEGNE